MTVKAMNEDVTEFSKEVADAKELVGGAAGGGRRRARR